jgi:asparagine synthase (glutamine-hydrolysing)
MISACGRYVLVLNGEIHNHRELRGRLGGDQRWRGRSDTETLLECIVVWGLTVALQRANGSFALAVWDTVEWRLTLARDRLGQKPLYWGVKDGVFLFASELGPILTSGLAPFRVDEGAVSAFLNLGYIPDPKSILRGIHKLEPARVLEVRCEGEGFIWQQEAYWSLAEAMGEAVRTRPSRSEAAWMEEVEDSFERAVRLRMATGSLGAFLSGGVDSGLIVAMMSKIADAPVRTFTISMPAGLDEAPRARELADHLGTNHTEIPISEQDCLSVIPKLPRIYTEPFGDSSQIPTYIVSAAARREVVVALSGDGGDELFGGYNRHIQAKRIWNVLSRLPSSVRWATAGLAASGIGQRAVVAASSLVLGGGVNERRVSRIQKGGQLLAARSVPELYRCLVMQWPEGETPTTAGGTWQIPLPVSLMEQKALDQVEQLMAIDMCTVLPGNMLVKVDRASMAQGLEVRVPFLDHEFVALALRVPPALKIQGGQGKVLLRRILARHAPPGWMDTPEAKRKTGFAIPLIGWLKNELRDWAEDLISDKALHDNPFLDAVAVRRRWNEFIQEGAAWEHPLWYVLMFQGWVKEHARYLDLS